MQRMEECEASPRLVGPAQLRCLAFQSGYPDPDKIIRFGKSRANDAAAELEYRGESGGQMSTAFAPDLDVKGERVSGRASLIDPLVAPVILSHNLPRCSNNPSPGHIYDHLRTTSNRPGLAVPNRAHRSRASRTLETKRLRPQLGRERLVCSSNAPPSAAMAWLTSQSCTQKKGGNRPPFRVQKPYVTGWSAGLHRRRT